MRPENRSQIKPSEITSESIYLERRRWLREAGVLGVGAAFAWQMRLAQASYSQPTWLIKRFQSARYRDVTTTEVLTPFKDVTGYNNFYEFGLDKTDPAEQAWRLTTDPWSVRVDGDCDAGGVFHLEDILRPHPLEDRVYRFRCVEAWSMVIPWVGFPLGALLQRFKPRSTARYVVFTTLNRPSEMPGQRQSVLNWPYVEGLRMDEAMHPLAIMAVGLYGKPLLPQNGAPLRLVVPWKYGFKSIKSIVAIHFSEQQPVTTWAASAPNEYGFYANVNPHVDHPRWTQSRERRLPATLWDPHWMSTQMLNGYEKETGYLYKGMDLRRYF